jgi:hypothetical protein
MVEVVLAYGRKRLAFGRRLIMIHIRRQRGACEIALGLVGIIRTEA